MADNTRASEPAHIRLIRRVIDSNSAIVSKEPVALLLADYDRLAAENAALKGYITDEYSERHPLRNALDWAAENAQSVAHEPEDQ